MLRTALRGALPLSLGVLALLVALSTVATIAPAVPARAGSALLTVFLGSATVARAGAAPSAGRTGDRLSGGDTVSTGAGSKAGVFYPDGSVTRLDSDTTVTVAVGPRGADLVQSSGLTWNRVNQLLGGSHFRVRGPNDAAVEVRGTEFGYYVEHDATGAPVIWIDTWSGSVQVTAGSGPPVTATTGQRVTVRQGAAPAGPVPIPDSDRQLSFTVFNEALDAVTGTAVAFASGVLSTGATSAPGSVAADGRHDLQLVLAWPGSTFQLSVRDPLGASAAVRSSSSPPLSIALPKPAAGTWTFTVQDLQSSPGEAWWVVVGRS